jgi:toxin secretion/phage lysis holin
MPRDKALCMSQYAGKEDKGLMKQTVLKTTAAVLGAGLVSYLGTLAVPMLVLLGVMLLDYITGMIKAYIRAELNSKFGIKGILKKLCYMVMVAVGAAVDYLLRGALVQAGIDLHIKLFCSLLVAIWLIINELISVMENLAAIGVPGFPRLSKLLERLKNTVSKEEEEK